MWKEGRGSFWSGRSAQQAREPWETRGGGEPWKEGWLGERVDKGWR
jgi:hypothetical protein